MQQKDVFVYDVETYREAFILCARNVRTKENIHFEISFRQDDTIKMLQWLKSDVSGMIGYNVIGFDYPVLHWIIFNYQRYNQYSLPEAIYNEANRIINTEFSSIRPKDVLILQLDLYKIYHYNNPARATSLKWLEFAMRMKNIQDLPYEPQDELTSDMIDEIIEYCHHDVKATYLFYEKSHGVIDLRKKLQAKYKLPLINASDVGIAETLVLNSYCKQTNKNIWDVRKLRSEYKYIQAKDVVLPLIKFETDYMIKWFESFKNTYLLTPRGTWKGCTINLFDEKYDVGLGGLHIEQKSLAFYREENMFLAELDCAGMYPTFICNHGMYPAHLGEGFLTLYRNVRIDRMKAKKSGDKIMDAAGKLMGNGVFGKFGSDMSYLFDLKMLYTTTLNNQLFLLMLIEQCGINGLKVISANTDSITINISNLNKSILEDIVEKWEKVSLHTMEYTPYDCIIYRDVNNYISKTCDGKVKSKGCFEHHRDYHKNHSMMIIPIALEQYYINNIPIEEIINNHEDIFDFCKAVKGKGGTSFVDRCWDKESNSLIDKPLQRRVNRYIVSNDGNKLIKILPEMLDEDGDNKRDKIKKYREKNPQQLDMFHFIDDVKVKKDRESEVEAGHKTTILNVIDSENAFDYDINRKYYINECNKIINQIK